MSEKPLSVNKTEKRIKAFLESSTTIDENTREQLQVVLDSIAASKPA